MKFFQIDKQIINIETITFFDEHVINFVDGNYIRIYSSLFHDLKDFIFIKNKENKEG